MDTRCYKVKNRDKRKTLPKFVTLNTFTLRFSTLSHFTLLVYFCTPWKYQKKLCFLCSQGVQWYEIAFYSTDYISIIFKKLLSAGKKIVKNVSFLYGNAWDFTNTKNAFIFFDVPTKTFKIGISEIYKEFLINSYISYIF